MDIDRALGRAWRDDAPWELLTRLAEIDERLGGHPGERRAADAFADALRGAGVRNVRRETFEMRRWTRGTTELAVRVPDRGVERSFEAVALPYSPPAAVEAGLVDVGHGTPTEIEAAEVAGDVVVARIGTPPEMDRFYHRMEKVGHAATAGAAGFVFANGVPGQLPPTGALRFNGEAAIPGVGVSRETGAWLREYAAEGATASLRVDADTDAGTSRNVRGRIGPDTDEFLLLCAHYDAHDVGEGALDNGCGVAALLGAVRILADAAEDLGVGVRIAGTGCEELGLIGSEALADRLDADRIRAVVNVDGAGRFRRFRALTHATDGLEARVRDVVEGHDHPLAVERRPHPYSDHWPFLRQGVPALQIHSERSDDEGDWERGFTHTRADTRDKADPRTIREHAMLTALVVRELAGSDVDLPRPAPARLAERFVEAGAKPSMEAAGIWPDGWG